MAKNRRWKIRRRRRDERGAVAIVFAMLVIVIFGVAAFGVDIAQQVNRKHELISQLDAAATAAAAKLGGQNGSIAEAVGAAQTFYAANGEGTLETENIDFWCVVARKLNGDNTPFDPARVADLQIPTAVQSGGVCNPDAVRANEDKWWLADYQNRRRGDDPAGYAGDDMTCSGALCAIPCGLNATAATSWNPGNSIANGQPIKCNTIRVGADDDVPFSFAPVIGIDEGSTGSQVSIACAGSCGSVAPNPMDVVVIADRTLSMTVPLGCTISGGTCHDYRQDLVAGIQSMLKVMTPEQQYVALGALGPSDSNTRDIAQSKSCNSKGLVYPSDQASTSSKGTWIPTWFNNDYLGAADSNGQRSLKAGNKLVDAVDCVDAVDSTREQRLAATRTALASPLKAAARFLLGKDANNIAALGGGGRSGTVRKVIIFETDGEPWEAAATTAAGTLSLDSSSDVFSNSEDYTDSGPTTSGPVLANAVNGNPNALNPDPPAAANNQFKDYPSTYKDGNNQNRSITYKYRTNTTTKAYTRTAVGGQNACANFKAVANAAKAAGILVITIGYNLDSSTMCSKRNEPPAPPSPTNTYSQPYISDLSPATTSCRSGNGTQASPYIPKTSCNQNMTVTYTVPNTYTSWTSLTGAGDDSVTNVLASASGGPDKPSGASTGCTGSSQIAAENADDDLFFCAAQGQDLAPLFVTALSKVTSGVKLIRLPTS
jgi:hypothetical protein